MSDYLTNLVSRSTQQGNLLAPRLPSVFESRTNDVPSQFFESFDEGEKTLTEPHSTEQRSVKPTTRPESFAPQAVVDPEVSERQELKLFGEMSLAVELPDDDLVNETTFAEKDDVGALVETPDSLLSSPQSISDPNAKLEEERSAVQTLSKNLPGRDKIHIAKVPPPSPHAPKQTRTAKQFRVGDEPADPPLPVEVLREVNSSDGNHKEPSNKASKESTTHSTDTKLVRRSGEASVARERELRGSLPMDQLLDRSSLARYTNPNGPSATESTEPVINVTIGRIEVRATQSLAPEKRGSQRSPVMPLDDYLKLQRRGGTR